MSTRTPTTEYANLALDELFQLTFVCQQLAGSLKHDESKLHGRNKKWPELPPLTNQKFNSAAFRYLGDLLLCQSVDIYNWYCRASLKLALSSSPQLVVDVIRKQTGTMAVTVSKADGKGKNAADEIIQKFLSDRYAGDKIIRDTIHRNLNVMQNPEIELLCTCRNILVHRRGHDEYGQVTDEIQKLGSQRALIGAHAYPQDHMPIALNADNRLIINESIGDWAAELFAQQIFMMDQNFAHIYRLSRKVWERCSIGRTFLTEPKH